MANDIEDSQHQGECSNHRECILIQNEKEILFSEERQEDDDDYGNMNYMKLRKSLTSRAPFF
jgi:hypothetical protein